MVCGVGGDFSQTPLYDSKPVHRPSCLSSFRPDGFNFLGTWQGGSG